MKHVQNDQSKLNTTDDDDDDDSDYKTEDEELQENFTELQKKLKDKEEDVTSLTKLLLKEKKSSDELQRAKEELDKKFAELQKNPRDTDEDVGALTKLLLKEKKSNDEMKRQMEELRKKSLQLERKFKAKNVSELEKGLNDFEELNKILIVKELMSNNELQEAREELIKGLKDFSGRRTIGVKRMGELNNGPFLRAMKKKYSYNLAQAKNRASEECSLWEEYLRDPSWQPFKFVTVDGKPKEIIDPEDEKLKDVENEHGSEVYKAVVSAVVEMNEYNPSGRYPTTELWNYIEGRKATLKEGISYVLNLDKQKRR